MSKDDDFHRLAVLRGAPPQFVWIRLGNCTTADIGQLLRRHHDDIVRFSQQNEATVLELSQEQPAAQQTNGAGAANPNAPRLIPNR